MLCSPNIIIQSKWKIFIAVLPGAFLLVVQLADCALYLENIPRISFTEYPAKVFIKSVEYPSLNILRRYLWLSGSPLHPPGAQGHPVDIYCGKSQCIGLTYRFCQPYICSSCHPSLYHIFEASLGLLRFHITRFLLLDLYSRIKSDKLIGNVSKHLKGHLAPRVSNVTFLDQRVFPGSLSVTWRFWTGGTFLAACQ